MIRILEYKEGQALAARKAQRLDEAEAIVAPILADVRKRGDAALLTWSSVSIEMLAKPAAVRSSRILSTS